MKFRSITAVAALAILAAGAQAQTYSNGTAIPDTVDGHLAAAKEAAGVIWKGTMGQLCFPTTGTALTNYLHAAAGYDAGTVPPRERWYAPPQKAFDNLYRLGTQVNSSWALVDPRTGGIILIDTLFAYANEAEIIDGLKQEGLDPANIKYVLLSHGHIDHDEGVKMLQDRYHVKAVAGADDWDLMINGPDMPGGKPARDISGKDGQKITVGDTTVTVVETPGHTDGTLSWIFPVLDHGKKEVVAYSGGTLVSLLAGNPAKFDRYIASNRHMAEMAAAAGATVVLSNHTEYDNSAVKIALNELRQPGEPNRLDVTPAELQRYFKVSEECAMATKARTRANGS